MCLDSGCLQELHYVVDHRPAGGKYIRDSRMKTRYKITIIAFSALVGTMFIPMVTSNLYCDYLADSCTSRITGVGPGGVYLPAEWGTREGCFVVGDDGTAERCRIDIAQINWPFPPRMHEL